MWQVGHYACSSFAQKQGIRNSNMADCKTYFDDKDLLLVFFFCTSKVKKKGVAVLRVLFRGDAVGSHTFKYLNFSKVRKAVT